MFPVFASLSIYVAAKLLFKRNYSFVSERLISLMMPEKVVYQIYFNSRNLGFRHKNMFRVSLDSIICMSDIKHNTR